MQATHLRRVGGSTPGERSRILGVIGRPRVTERKPLAGHPLAVISSRDAGMRKRRGAGSPVESGNAENYGEIT